ncbi:hypothetical protein [Simkania sp.]|uniref:hypothetical protein n=1 Tax=Simkania sp. TaxID=34094 RepID=UPI003B5189B0
MGNTINNVAAFNYQQPKTPPISNDPTVIASEMLVDLKAIENTLGKLDPQIIATKLMKEMTEVAAKEGIKLTPEQLKTMSDEAQKIAQQIAYDRASGNYYPTLLANEVNSLNNIYYQDITLGLDPGDGQPQLPDNLETAELLGMTQLIKFVLDSFNYTPSYPPGANPTNIIDAAGQGPDAMSEFLEAVITQPGEITSVIDNLNGLTNQMESLLGHSSSSSPTEIDASEIDAAAKPGSEIDAGAKLIALIDAGASATEIDAGPMIDATAMRSSLIDA